jgi:hypothetical protein
LLQRQSGLLARRLQSRRVTHVSPLISEPQTTSAGLPGLERQAGRITEDLRQLHWDNCKANFDRRLAYRYVLRALREGHNAARILKCYERALQECHALATDRTASRGQICRFELSSTVRRAKRSLARNQFPGPERIRLWQGQRQQSTNGDSCGKSGPANGGTTGQGSIPRCSPQ